MIKNVLPSSRSHGLSAGSTAGSINLASRMDCWIPRSSPGTTVIWIATLLFTTISWAASHHPQDFLKEIAGSKTEGKQIVQHYCAMCHTEKPMIQLGAPIAGQSAAWAPRVKQGLDMLFKHADEGLNAMPARGGCFECTDEQLMLAIKAMLPKDSK